MGDDKPLRILQIIDDLEVGGAQRVVLSIANWMSERGHHVAVLAAPGGQLWNELHPSVERLPNRPSLRRIAATMTAGSFDLVHAHQRGVALRANVVSLGRSTVIEHAHNIVEGHRRLSFKSQSVIAVGSAVRQHIVRNYGVEEGRVCVVANGVEGATTTVEIPTLPPLRLLGVGRLAEQKDPHFFIDVIGALRNRGVDILAKWVGDGPLRESVTRRTHQLGLQDVLSFDGESRDVRAELKRCHAMLLTSLWEGLPLAILEAMAEGRPVIARDVGSCRDAVDQATGILFEPDLGPEVVAQTIIDRTRLDRTWFTQAGQCAERLFTRSFTLEASMQKVYQVYQRTLNDRG